MSASMTKTQLLERMAELAACGEATKWVTKSKERTAKTIWETCPNASWMLWLYQRVFLGKASDDITHHMFELRPREMAAIVDQSAARK